MIPHRYRSRIVACAVTACSCFAACHAPDIHAQPVATTLGATAHPLAKTSWPRMLEIGGKQYAVYQPQINAWRGNRLSGHMAVAVLSTNDPVVYGVTRFTAEADIDKSQDEVHLTQVKVTAAQIPAAANDGLRDQLGALLPVEMTLRLSELQLSYTASKQLSNRHAMLVSNTPPKIHVKTDPTVLLLIDGDPVLATVAGHTGWQRVINSRALVLRAPDGDYHAHAAGHWYTAKTLSGSWHSESASRPLVTVAATVAQQFEVDPLHLEGTQDPATAPALWVSSEPTELILLDGPARLRPVSGTSLISIANADHPLFILPSDHRYYLLISGRWFSADNLQGAWRHVPGNQLNAEFAHISLRDPLAGVLTAVPGTSLAKEALIAATIPQTATVSRREAMLHVRYMGDSPQFADVVGTPLHFATNTPVPVIQVTAQEYYALYQAVWFTAESPNGPWRVADAVTPAIYTIPPESPLHYVSYVHVYDATADTVVVGYTPGYLGLIISPEGTVVYGTGYPYPPAIVRDRWVGFPPTYGYNAALDTTLGLAFGFSAGTGWVAEPYWGPFGELPYARGVDINRIDVYDTWAHGIVRRSVGYHDWSGQELPTQTAAIHHRAADVEAAPAGTYPAQRSDGPLYGDDQGHVYRHAGSEGWVQYTPSGWQPVQRKNYSHNDVTEYLDGQRRARIGSVERYAALHRTAGAAVSPVQTGIPSMHPMGHPMGHSMGHSTEDPTQPPSGAPPDVSSDAPASAPSGEASARPTNAPLLSPPCPTSRFHTQRRSETPAACDRPGSAP